MQMKCDEPPLSNAGIDMNMRPYGWDALRRSKVRRVVMVGRRGAAQAAFSPKELRELLSLPGVKAGPSRLYTQETMVENLVDDMA